MNTYIITYENGDFQTSTEEIDATGYYIEHGERRAVTFYNEEKVTHPINTINPYGDLEKPLDYIGKVPYIDKYISTHRVNVATFFNPFSVKIVTKEYNPEQQTYTEEDI